LNPYQKKRGQFFSNTKLKKKRILPVRNKKNFSEKKGRDVPAQ